MTILDLLLPQWPLVAGAYVALLVGGLFWGLRQQQRMQERRVPTNAPTPRK